MCSKFSRLTREKSSSQHVSVQIISSSPEEESYVMVLRCKTASFKDATTSVKNISNVTFQMGEDRVPVYGIRAKICARSRVLKQLIEIAAANKQCRQRNMRSKVKKSLSELGWLSCGVLRRRSIQNHLEIPVTTFDVTTFRRLMTYIQCGILTVEPSTVIGLMNAAYIYQLPEVLQACWDFAVLCAVREDNFQDLLDSAGSYKDYAVTLALLTEIKQRETDFPVVHTFRKQLNTLVSDNASSVLEDNVT